MPKLNLSQTYIRNGKFYQPGEADLPDDVYKDLKAREAELAPKQPADEPNEAPASPDPLSDFPELRAAGYDSVELVRAASDEDLRAVKGIGDATLKRIREATRE